ncbi:Planctomycete cytochrome C [Rosistilla oblonga]|nr:Planctomycete cytochrome C [Rosistilla oblonga]
MISHLIPLLNRPAGSACQLGVHSPMHRFLPTLLAVISIVVATASRSPGDSPPVARWDFGSEEATPMKANGNLQRDQAGPRPPEFPDLDASNTAVRFDGGYFSIPDSGADSEFDFTNGDAITLEAWVSPIGGITGSPHVVIGKGRTGSPKFARDNQNWALRLAGKGSEAKVNFLFASKLGSGDRHWHRWTSKQSFRTNTGWYHIAISYRFGDPSSIRGYINGEPTTGTWDMGGATKLAPVVDDDEIRIGSGFKGLIDAVAVHREVLDEKVMAARFRRVGEARIARLQPEVMPQLQDLPEGRVMFQISGGLPSRERWLYEGEEWPAESMRWAGDEFLLSRLPMEYDSWGIRSSWKAPLLLRMAADVELPAGTHRFLMRVREQARLWVDGQLVAKTKSSTGRPPDGEEPMQPLTQPPLPGHRLPGYRQQEVVGEATIETAGDSETRRCRVVLELVVGGPGRRTETGEICVAMLSPDGKRYDLLGAGDTRLPLTDAAVVPAIDRIEQQLVQLDDQRRRAAAASQDPYWDRRHEIARQWAAENPADVDVAAQAADDQNPIDRFVAAKIAGAVAASADTDPKQAEHFHGKVLPLLREQCFRCHGEKSKGDLKLNSREAALKAGESEIPAVVPGDLDASELISQIRSGAMPPTDDGLSEPQIELLEQWVRDGAVWPAPPLADADVALAAVVDDQAFLRRIYLDTVGVPPTFAEAQAFLADSHPDKRTRLIDGLLDDPRYADHWMSFWLDALAENPSLLNASLNSTGPFRWFVYEALRDDKPLDRMVTELLMLRGGAAEGGSAGFGIAAENDAPMAAKGHIIASAFLGIELQCARCHDSPYHSTSQRDLYSLAAMMGRKSVTVPKTSRVPDAFFESQKDRVSLIQVTLKPDEPVTAEWPFAAATGAADGPEIDALMMKPSDTRERLAALITTPQNTRFAEVIVNRIWKQLIGAGLVEPVHDWEGSIASHPGLLQWLARELVASGYDTRHIVRLIATSDTYQRAATGKNLAASAELRFFNATERRRLTAEQVVDSLHQATGREIDVEPLTFVHDGRAALGSRQTLGSPSRAWMFGDLKNERDRPSLSLPKARAVVDVLEAFGWTGARQMPIVDRETDPNVLQPGILANGTLSMNLTRAAYKSDLAELALDVDSPDQLVETLFLRFLCRTPTDAERQAFTLALADGFDARIVPDDEIVMPEPPPRLQQVTWFNHLRPKANEIQVEMERRANAGPIPDPRLQADWREVYEDIVWSLVNHREFVWIP